jgi:RNA polymerase sigma factor (sigma-70 family)
MPANPMNAVIQHLRQTVLLYEGAEWTDGQLLRSYIERRDEAAFAAIVKRHGPMVWGVCCRLLRSHHDAEDAFQATFLVLVRKATAIVPRELLANWLYGVAQRTALKARALTARRQRREKQVMEMPEPAMEPDLWDDLQPLLDQELSRLPAKYRAVIVLCDLEGRSRKEAARQLGCPEGTVASRLAVARKLLAKRLARHGLSVSGGVLAAVLSQTVVSAAVPVAVVSATIKAATLVAAGQAAATGAVSVKVVALTEGMLKAMLLSKLKITTAVLLVLATLLGGAGLIYRTQAAAREGAKDQQPAAGPAEEPKADKNQRPGAANKNEKPLTDRARLQGTWKILSTVKNGEKAADEGTWTIKGRHITFQSHPKKGKSETYNFSFTRLDEKTTPRSIDFVGRLTNFAPTNTLITMGIYSIAGDTLTICVARVGRPTVFKSTGSDVVLWTLQRQGAKAKPREELQTRIGHPRNARNAALGQPKADKEPLPALVMKLEPRSRERVNDKAGSWLFEDGKVMRSGKHVGSYTSVQRLVNNATAEPKAATVTTTLFFIGTTPPENLTLQGAHDLGAGDEIGSVSAASPQLSAFIGKPFTRKGNTLTIK